MLLEIQSGLYFECKSTIDILEPNIYNTMQ